MYHIVYCKFLTTMPTDAKKITFIKKKGSFSYQVIPFGLKEHECNILMACFEDVFSVCFFFFLGYFEDVFLFDQQDHEDLYR